MHQYLDSDGSGTSETCVSSTIGAERLQAATQWLQANNLKGFLGEIGAGSNAACIAAVQGALCEMQQSGVCWARSGGPPGRGGGREYRLSFVGGFEHDTDHDGSGWGCGLQYYQSIEPPNGTAVAEILPQALEPFL
uniref:cellulase n=1 Tax=Ganoderma boninense TaxID=34458 RepID=A0A5K1JXT6_9APHY|nr:Alcohol oxidase [Ganoderma boninense]